MGLEFMGLLFFLLCWFYQYPASHSQATVLGSHLLNVACYACWVNREHNPKP